MTTAQIHKDYLHTKTCISQTYQVHLAKSVFMNAKVGKDFA